MDKTAAQEAEHTSCRRCLATVLWLPKGTGWHPPMNLAPLTDPALPSGKVRLAMHSCPPPRPNPNDPTLTDPGGKDRRVASCSTCGETVLWLGNDATRYPPVVPGTKRRDGRGRIVFTRHRCDPVARRQHQRRTEVLRRAGGAASMEAFRLAEWRRDLKVACPECRAESGDWCANLNQPSMTKRWPHRRRSWLAMTPEQRKERFTEEENLRWGQQQT